MNKAVFLDRDGTINVDTGYISNPEDLTIINGAKKALKIFKKAGFLIFIITNQSGVGRGYFSQNELEAVNEKLLSILKEDGISVEGISFCIHHPDIGCECRKPKPKMVFDFAKKYKIDLSKSFFIGDKNVDVETGRNAGCGTVLIRSEKYFLGESKNRRIEPDFIAEDLLEAAKYIIQRIAGSV